ncbi:hypothetical protein SDC9_199817 [bioreactor metagenome]|uniref:Uncharacterized protein n=1 Tax=bioreactor metagenome TaxID=1076179 RepID=A0A645IY65_9ZZZZ
MNREHEPIPVHGVDIDRVVRKFGVGIADDKRNLGGLGRYPEKPTLSQPTRQLIGEAQHGDI